MQRAREEVRNVIPIDVTPVQLVQRVLFLLEHDRFMCGTGGKEGAEVRKIGRTGLDTDGAIAGHL